MTTDKLALITTTLNGITTRSVDHPEHGPLIMAADLAEGLGYQRKNAVQTMNEAGVPKTDRVIIIPSVLSPGKNGRPPLTARAAFLTRKGVNLVLMFSGKPIAQETRQWLAGDVMPAIADTGGYLLNEAARDTARADARQTMPLPEHLGGASGRFPRAKGKLTIAAWRAGRQPSNPIIAQLIDAGYDVDAIAKRQGIQDVPDPAKDTAEAANEPNFRIVTGPLVIVKAGEVYAKSYDVAAYFGKRHSDVLQDIDRLVKTGGDNLHRLMFQQVSAFDPRANRETRSFDMNRDGFALLVMGYTGPKALRFKLAYLDRFNAMEKQLREVPQVAAPLGIEQMMAAMTASMTTAIAQAMQAVLQASGKAPEVAPQAKRVIPEKPRTGTLKHWGCLPFSIHILVAVAMWHTATWAKALR